VITNETGVRYHFALPAYSYAEYSQQRKRTGTTTYNDFHKPGRYAYTWYLTAITGPDFVDRGPHGAPDGILNDYDYGHWVEFDYGKWSDHYAWRNPGQGMTPDIDNRFRNFSEGKKELYFLDAIRTKSHTALFVKDIRYDAKSSVYFFHNLTETRELDGDVKRRQTPTEDSREGGFVPKVGRCKCEKQADGIFGEMDDQDLGYLDYTAVPVSSLKLSSILLVANKDLATVSLSKMHGLPYAQSDNFTWDISENRSQFGQCDFSSFVIKYHEYQNVLDIHDLANAGDLASKVLRRIDFDTDYSLSPETENSFDHSLITSTSKSTNPEDYPRHGKLTLNAVNYRGKGGAIGLPPTKFKYDYAERWHGGKLSKRDATFLLEEHDVELDVGALIKFNSASKTYYALVESVDGTAKVIRFLGKNMQPAIGNILYAATKNPPYNNLAHDVWGLYKSDFRDLGFNEKIEQIVTETSAKSLDVWSLRSVKSTTGAEIKLDFESDTYGKPVLSLYNDIAVTNMEKVGSSSILKLSTSFPNLDRILKPGTTIAYVFGFADPYSEFDLDNWAWIYGIEPEIGTGEIVVQSIYRDSNGQWIVSTNSDLQKFYDKRSDSGAKSFHAPIFVVGNLNSTAQVQNYGGGVRVKSITVESFNHSTTTQYDYRIPTSGPDHFTSGVTAYEPGAIDQMIYMYPSSGETKKFFDNTSKRTKFEKAFCREYYKGFEQLLVNSREVIAPGVLYQFVTTSATSTIEGQTTPSENYSVSEFQMFSKDLIDIQYAHDHERTFSQREYAGTNYSKKERRTVTVKDHSAQVGSLKRMTLYSRNGEKLSETRNIFLHDGVPVSAYEAALDSKFNNQGVIEETYTDARFASRPDDDFTLQGVVTKRERYPAVQLGQVTKNFKTGITSKDSTIAFDFYSGKAIATISKDGYGNVYKSVTTPAFRVYPAMRQRSEGGLNMLAQEAGTATFKVNPNDYSEHIGVVGASVQTWSNALPAVMPAKPLLQDITIQPGIWRMHASYSFIGDDNIELQNDGLFPVANYSSFGSWNGSGTTPGWQKNNAITLYDVNSHALEVIDLNQKYAATQMSLDQGKVSATIVNARYNEFAVSSAEERTADLIGSFVAAGDGDLSGAHSHTGRYSLKVFGSDHGFDSEVWITQKQKQYLMNVWVHESNVLNLVMDYHFLSESAPPVSSISFTADSKRKAGEWYLWEAVIITPEAVLEDPVDFRLVVSIRNSGSSPVFLDDFRLFPRDAAVISYVYNTWGELSHILDSNNKFTRFEYDQFGRLVTTSSESFEFDVKKVSSQIYHYGEQN
jgi:YD repeat-containing protein